MKKLFLIAALVFGAATAFAQCPNPYYVFGGGTVCTGSTPPAIGLTQSQSGVTYRLYRSGSLLDIKSGTGSSFTFGTYTTAGTYNVTATGSGGCVVNMQNTVSISYVSGGNLSITPSTTPMICQGTSITLTAGGGSNYSWTSSQGGSWSGASITVTPSVTTDYTLNGMESTCNQSRTASIHVTVTPLVGQVSAPNGITSRCQGSGTSAYTASASSAASYSWSLLPVSAGSISGGTVTWSSTFSGTATVTVTANGCNSSSTSASTNVVVTPIVGQVSAPSGTTVRCIGSGTSSYTASASSASSNSWTISPSSAGSVSNGTVTWSSTFSGTATVTVTAYGCNSSLTSASTNVTVNPNVGQVSQPSGTTTRCQASGTSSYSASASGATSYSWSMTPSAGTISSSGVVTWSSTFAGTASIQVTAFGCNGSSTSSSLSVLTNPTTGQVSAPAGVTSRCQGSGTNPYAASAFGATSYSWAISPGTAGTISSSGSVTWNSTFTGTATITVTATGCGSTSASTNVVTTPLVGQVSAPAGTTTRCQGSGTSSYSASASSATSYSWSISPATAGSISSLGTVTWSSSFSGTAVVTVTANGCNSSTSTSSANIIVTPLVGPVSAPAGTTSRCQGGGTTAYSASASSASSYSWSISPAAAGTITSSGVVTWSSTFSGPATITVTATGCNSSTSSSSTIVNVTPTVGPVSAPAGTTSRCLGSGTDTYAASASSASSYVWSISPAAAGTMSGATVTWNNTFSGTATVYVTANGCGTSSASTNVTVSPLVGSVSTPSGTTLRCQGDETTSYSASALNATSYSWSVSPAAAGTVTSSGIVTWSSTFSGIATISVTANGCNSSSTASAGVTVTPLVGTVSSPTGTTERCIGDGTDTYTATASNASSYSWSISPVEAGTISSSGTVTWSSTFSGPATVTVTATGCNSSSTTATKNVNVSPLVGQVSAPSGTLLRCVGAGSDTYTANASAATSYTWTISPVDAGTISNSGVVTWSNTFTGTAIISVTASGCQSSTSSSSSSVTVTPNVGQVSQPGGVSARCQGSGTDSYVASATDANSYTWSLSPVEAGTISALGVVTWSSSFSGNSTVSVTANGCGASTSASLNVVITPLVGNVVITGAPSRCQGAGTSTFTATAPDATSYSWALAPAAAGTISSLGVITWNTSFSGTATVTANAYGCNNSTSSGSVGIIVTALVGQVSAPSGTTSRCRGAGTSTYAASATSATSYTWSITPVSAGTISAGTVTWSSSFSGTATITVIANGCNASTTTASTNVTVTPWVGAVSQPSGVASRCFGSGTSAYTASATNATSYAWSLTPTTAGTISTSGVVTWSATFTGAATVGVTANGCGGSTSTNSRSVTVMGTVGQVSAPAGATTRCIGAGTNTYSATATYATSYSWSMSPVGAGTISSSGVVTWSSSFSGTATVTVRANGCSASTSSASTSVTVNPNVSQVSNPAGATSRCQGTGTSTYAATAGFATSYTWTLTPAAAGTIANGVVTWSSTFNGTASVKVTANGCNSSTSVGTTNVTVHFTPAVFSVSVPATVCVNTTTTISLSGSQSGVSYQLFRDNVATGSAVAGTGSPLNWSGMGTGTYKVTATNNSCTPVTMTNQPVVTQVGPPSAAVSGATKVDETAITLSASTGTGYTYQWFRDGIQLSGKTASTLSVTDAGSYHVAIAKDGCTVPSPGHYVTKAVKRYYNGTIASVRWRTDKPFEVTGTDFVGMYNYSYDSKYQIKGAEWQNPNFVTNTYTSAGNLYRLSDMTYDANGNIYTLRRFDGNSSLVNNFAYHYQPKTNKLADVTGYADGYSYDQVGQMIAANKSGTAEDQFVDYDVSGKVVAVYSDAGKTTTKVEYKYDDRGFRLAKIAYETSPASKKTTWYIRDNAGNILSIYEQVDAGDIYEKEIPIYGASKLGTYESEPAKRNYGSVNYEITDHLGNVRAIVRDNTNVYTATMEDNGVMDITNPRVAELAYFENITETAVQDQFMDISTPIPTVVPDPNKAAYLFWNDNTGTQASDKAIGPAIALSVKAGDLVNVEAWGRFEEQTSFAKDVPLATLTALLAPTFVELPGFEGQNPTTVANDVLSGLTAEGFLAGETATSTPFAFLNYIVYNSSMVMLDAGWKRIPLEAGSLAEEITLPGNKPIKFGFDSPISITTEGYIYVWVSNQSKSSRVWFDDMTVAHTQAITTQATDYGPWGDVIRSASTDQKKYRFGYQGQFAENDDETGWDHFELREFDPLIGRWTVTDPQGQFFSPYVGMGNNPLMNVDPDGAYSWLGALWRNAYYGGAGVWYDEDIGSYAFDRGEAGLDFGPAGERAAWRKCQMQVMERRSKLWDFFEGQRTMEVDGQVMAVSWDGYLNGPAPTTGTVDLPIGGPGQLKGAYTVYKAVKNGRVVYWGITKNFLKRAKDHAARGWDDIIPVYENVSKSVARGIEQLRIEGGKNLENIINSVHRNNPKLSQYYRDAISYLKSLPPK
jgi:RHS repeat-associated protein